MSITSQEYFEKLPTGAQWELENVLENKEHPIHRLLIEDLNSIPNEVLKEWSSQNHIQRLISRENNKDLAARKWFLLTTINNSIAKKRLNLLVEGVKESRPEPYHDPDLRDLEIDKYGLVELRKFDCSRFGLGYHNQIFQLCPSLDQYNSCHWLFHLLIDEEFRQKKQFKIRIDPLVKVQSKLFKPYFQYMEIYGVKLDWKRIKALKNEETGQWIGNGLSARSIGRTDFVWSPFANEIHFTCEELPKLEWLEQRGSRYLHGIFNRDKGHLTHCDGALRIYQKDEFEYREHFHVRQPEVRKIGTRVKIFQIDQPIDQGLFMRLATNFLVWNEDALAYFN